MVKNQGKFIAFIQSLCSVRIIATNQSFNRNAPSLWTFFFLKCSSLSASNKSIILFSLPSIAISTFYSILSLDGVVWCVCVSAFCPFLISLWLFIVVGRAWLPHNTLITITKHHYHSANALSIRAKLQWKMRTIKIIWIINATSYDGTSFLCLTRPAARVIHSRHSV